MLPYYAHTDADSLSGDGLRPLAARLQNENDGFSLIEVLIVMVIMAILMALTIHMMSSAKSAGYKKEAITAARSFGTTIDAFASDHNGRVPRMAYGANNEFASAGSIRWGQGAVDTLTNRPYQRVASEGITNRTLLFLNAWPGTPGKGVHGVIVYEPGANPRHYRLRVVTPKGGKWSTTQTCYVGNNLNGGKEC